MVSLVILTSGFSLSWCSESNKLLLKRSPLSHALLTGVPQVSVLGPLLFLCHINDYPQRVTSKVRLFADDCLLHRPIHSPCDQLLLQQDHADLETWAEDWGMRFNVSKSYLMSIHRSKHPYSSHYKLDNHILEQVEENPYLGVTIH